MVLNFGLSNALNFILTNGGRPINLRYFTATNGSIYDEADTLTQSGNTVWTTALMFCPDPNNAEDTLLLEQGKIGMNDIRIYTNGSLMYSKNTGSVLQTIVGTGSPSVDYYTMIPIGAQSEEVNGVQIYKRAYLRRLTSGSLIGM